MKKRGSKNKENKNSGKSKKSKKKCVICIMSIIVLVFLVLYCLYSQTGFLQSGQIDKRDLDYWNYSMAGTIVGAEGFYIQGNKDVCWLMVHGYTSTPDDFKSLAKDINANFGDYVYVPRLKGHGTKPSDLLGLSFRNWSNQVKEDYDLLNKKCSSINLVGFSLGGSLVLDIEESTSFNRGRIFLISPLIKLRYKFWNILSKETIIKNFADIIVFTKKISPAQINSEKGLRDFIGYRNFPLQPLKNSFSEIENTRRNLYKINKPILIQHSKNDDSTDILSSRIIFSEVSTSKNRKQIVVFNKSNHVLLKDYDKERVIENIINFEKEFR